MESWIESTARGIKNKEVKRKSDGRSFTIYTIETDHGDFTTAKRELAEHAFQYLESRARYLVDTQQNGNFTNNYLQDIAPVPGKATADRPALGRPASFDEAVVSEDLTPDFAPEDEAPDSVRDNAKVPNTRGPDPQWSEKDMAIYRQVASKVSAQVSRTPEEYWQNLDEILAYIIDGTKPAEWSQS